MELCELCKENPADKTGSHIIPHFLVKRIDSQKGDKSRDKELGFSIGEFETTSYFGRSVLPEKLNDVFGEISEEEFRNNNNPFIIDNLFCTECENKISQVENEYAKTLRSKLADSGINSCIATIFWISVLWRMSVSKNQNLNLKSQEEEKLRRLLDNHLNVEIKNIAYEKIKADPDFVDLGYRLIRCPDYSDIEATYLVCQPYHKMPYSVIIDEFVLFFYFKKGHIDNIVQSFFGFEKDLKGKPINTSTVGETKIIYKKETFSECLSKMLELIMDRRIVHYNWIFDQIHVKLGGKGTKMPTEIKNLIIKKMIDDEKKLGRRYTFADLTKTMYEVLKNYAP